jgi:hypothetical protein
MCHNFDMPAVAGSDLAPAQWVVFSSESQIPAGQRHWKEPSASADGSFAFPASSLYSRVLFWVAHVRQVRVKYPSR